MKKKKQSYMKKIIKEELKILDRLFKKMEKSIQETKTYAQIKKSSLTAKAAAKMT